MFLGEIMNVYDFDKTIYDGDSTLDFYFYCLKKYPGICCFWIRQLNSAVKYKVGIIDKTTFKEEFYSYFRAIDDIEKDVQEFWDLQESKIKTWYIACQKEDDLIISASPEFLLREICHRVGIRHLIASRVDMYTGKYQGVNCYGEEKVKRFKEKYAGERIDKFYSDSKSDQPLADTSVKAYLVKGDNIKEWNCDER